MFLFMGSFISDIEKTAKAVTNFYERLNMVPGFYTNLECDKTNNKRIKNSITHSELKNVLRCRKIRGKKNEKMIKKAK